MTTFASILLTCTVCGAEFESNEICSCGFGSKRTDFRPNYWGFNPVEYFFHLCPECGFCASISFFKKNSFTEEFKNDIKALGPLDYQDLNSEYLSHKLEKAAICMEIINEHGISERDYYFLANMWIHSYWWAEKQSEIIRLGKIVLNYFEKALKEGQIPQDRYFDNLYLIGEIYRRIGDQEKAFEYFDEVIFETRDNEELKNLQDLAIQQKTEPKDIL